MRQGALALVQAHKAPAAPPQSGRRVKAMKFSALLLAAVMASASYAEGPGTRIRSTPEVPRAPDVSDKQDAKRCDTLRGDERDRCLRDRAARSPATEKSGGPETTGMGSGAGTGANAGTSGGASFGAAAPR
jgi:hypothetical protein